MRADPLSDAPSRIVLVTNGAAGSTNGGRVHETIRELFANRGLSVIDEPAPHLGLRERIEAAASLEGIDALAVAGGDGSLTCAASVLAGRALPLAILPLGTMNLLARDLGLPLDLDGAVATIAAGRVRRIDVGEVNGEIFLINSVLGMPARMARHREAQRGRESVSGALRMAAGMLRHFGRYPRLSVSVEAEDFERRAKVRALAVVDNDYAEAPGQVLARHRLDGGRLTLYLIPHLSTWTALRLGAGFVLGAWRTLPGVERHAAESFTVTARREALRVMNDGEVRLIAPPLRYRIHPRSLAVVVPPPTEGGRQSTHG